MPVDDSQDYIVCDRDLTIVQFSPNAHKYATEKLITGGDLLLYLPEIVGLESTCQEIISRQRERFFLETILRHQQNSELLYFNLLIKEVDGYLAIYLEDVTESTLLQQSSVQRLNEIEISLNRLQRFEYCTNKIIASMRDVLLIVSPAGIIERVNKSTTELFRLRKSALINQSIDDVIADANFNHQQIYSSLLNSQDGVRKIEVSFSRDRQIQIEFDCFIVPTEVRDFFNCVYIGRDITARKHAEAEIRKSLAREKELKELKSGFISMASHEFRNPLSSILLCVQNLQENLQSADVENFNHEFYLHSIQDAALTMNSLLEDILVLSKAESDKQILNLEPIELESFCRKIIQKLASIYPSHQVIFDYQTALTTVNLDRTTIWHILNNLLSNALKYSPSGSVVELVITDRQSQTITIEVRDRGIGIPSESQKHLFESFYRADNVSSLPGTGLGLSIVKKSVDLYRGTITVNSQVNRGTTITVQLPLR